MSYESDTTIFNANLTAASGTATVVMAGASKVSFQCISTTPTAYQAQLQTTNDDVANQAIGYGNAKWYTESTVISGSGGGTGQPMTHLADVQSKYCRLLLTPSVAGTVTVICEVKG